MSKYKIYINDSDEPYDEANNKDDVIQALMTWVNGDGVNMVKVVFPDGSYYLMTGDDTDDY